MGLECGWLVLGAFVSRSRRREGRAAPGPDGCPNEVLTERPGVLALGTSSCGWVSTIDGDGRVGAEQREDRDPGRATAYGDETVRGGPHEQGPWGPGDSLRCCRMDSADGLSGNECKRLRVDAQAHPGPAPLPTAGTSVAVTSRYPL